MEISDEVRELLEGLQKDFASVLKRADKAYGLLEETLNVYDAVRDKKGFYCMQSNCKDAEKETVFSAYGICEHLENVHKIDYEDSNVEDWDEDDETDYVTEEDEIAEAEAEAKAKKKAKKKKKAKPKPKVVKKKKAAQTVKKTNEKQ